MLKNILFTIQSEVVGPAERIEGARNYLGRSSFSTEDLSVIIILACITAGFIGLILWSYIKQILNKK